MSKDLERRIAYQRFLQVQEKKDLMNRVSDKTIQDLVTEYLKPENR